MDEYVVMGKEWFDQTGTFEYDADLVGQKSIGLACLPSGWTPAYAVITTSVFMRWKLESTHDMMGRLSWLAPFLSGWVDKLAGSFSQVIIRSSAVNESLEDRGTYTSRVCDANCETVIGELNQLYHDFAEGSPHQEGPAIAYIIQGYLGRHRFGHLSNERRVQRNRNNWLYEIEGGDSATVPSRGVLTSNIKHSVGLLDSRLNYALRQVANYFYTKDQDQRVHLEWVHDHMNRLWLVQVDVEVTKPNSAPGSEWRTFETDEKLTDIRFSVFKSDYHVSDKWDKIKCIRDFRDAGIPYGEVFVLEEVEVLRELAGGSVSEKLLQDINYLLTYPIVIRTDVSKGKKKEGFLFPRTETAMSADVAIKFLLDKVQYFLKSGLDFPDFCFIAHRFIVSRSCAFAFSRPGSPQVIVDGSWGLPDGLLYYPHDTYHLTEGRKGLTLRKHIRCKVDYLDVDTVGNWVKKPSGDNWDWAESLKEHQLGLIFQHTRALAKQLNKPIQLMFFVGVHPNSGHPDVLPWFYTDHTIGAFTLDSSQRYGMKRELVTNDADLNELKRKLEKQFGKPNFMIQIKLTPQFLRNEKLLEEISSVAIAHSIPVELEGSILSHAYYILQKKGVRVLCPDVMDDDSLNDTQTFGKLVRDKIPELIQSHGERATVVQLSVVQRIAYLKAKAIEEALELNGETDPTKAFEELADLYEVMKALLQIYKRSFKELEEEAAQKRSIRGGFEQGIVLLETSNLPLLDVQAHGLFEVEKTSVLRMNYTDHEQELRLSLQPQLKDGCLTIPLVPSPIEKPNTSTTIHRLNGGYEVAVKYQGKSVEVSIQEAGNGDIDPNQLTLF
ncbi:nucleoside triphosphate pyrophosphohydrolase [Cohnella abietis]|uniref:Uncharacterized protein n=1 Tax=Cohnella abietis TaxID=2507935 RepID=A0A3T1CY90_9BACL|nr:nucleoside triphosphate pyrophosphohydrolase [Cohnella abietis]BBI30798.1 hypothetical protein KCTCHS21_01970 [Cohnella abietis]